MIPPKYLAARLFSNFRWHNSIAIRIGLLLSLFIVSCTYSGCKEKNLSEPDFEVTKAEEEFDATITHVKKLIPQSLDSARALLVTIEPYKIAVNENLQANYYNQLGLFYWYTYAYDSAISVYAQTLALNPDKISVDVRIEALNNIGSMLFQSDRIDEALEHLNLAMDADIARGNAKGTAKTMYDLSKIHRRLGQYELAIRYLHQVINIQEKEKDDSRLQVSFNALANVYYDIDSTVKAKHAYFQSLALAKAKKDTVAMATVYNGIAAIYTDIPERLDSTIFYADQCIICTRAKNLPVIEAFALTNKGVAHLKAGNPDEALRYFEQVDDDLVGPFQTSLKAGVSLFRAKAFFKKKEYERAYLNALDAVKLAEKSKTMKTLKLSWFTIASIDSIRGNYKDYIEHFHNGLTIQNEISCERNKARIAELLILNNVDSKVAVIDRLVQDNRTKKIINYLGAGFTFLIVMLLLTGLKLMQNRHLLSIEKLKVSDQEGMQKHIQVEKLELEKMLTDEKLERLELEAELTRQDLIYQSLRQSNLNMINNSIREKLGPYKLRLTRKKDQDAFERDLDEICRDSSRDPLADFENMFVQMHGKFYEKLLDENRSLTRTELQLCALLRMNLPSKQIASMLNLSVSRIDQTRHQIRRKLELDSSHSLTGYLISL